MRKFGVTVPVAALLSGVLAAGAVAQEPGREPAKLPPKAVLDGREAPRGGNPLWAISITELSQTRARPLFSPSRRPPAPPQLAALTSSPAKPAPSKREADHPLLTLLGTVVSASVGIGVFADEASHDVIRLKVGDVHDGWTLSSVVGRTAIFQKEGYRAATLVFPPPGATIARAAPPVIQPIAIQGPAFGPELSPAAAKGGSRRPPKEG